MPSSRPNTIPTVIHLVRQLQPRSILDIGVGFGKWGHLFREYTDVLEAEHDPARYQRENWRVRIDGIEGHAPYVTEMHRYLYNEIHVGDATAILKNLPSYDLIFLGDIIEHLEKKTGEELLRDALGHARLAVIVSTPKYETDQGDVCGNQLERHRSLWRARDFKKIPGATIKTIDGDTLLAVLVKPGVPTPACHPPRRPRLAELRRMRECRQQLVDLVPVETPFILVDEEHIRSTLPHARAIPFLEKNGIYWGPPPDDSTAITELERLRGTGARFLAFAWPSFWWLEHYARFAEHLRSTCSRVKETDSLILFALRS